MAPEVLTIEEHIMELAAATGISIEEFERETAAFELAPPQEADLVDD